MNTLQALAANLSNRSKTPGTLKPLAAARVAVSVDIGKRLNPKQKQEIKLEFFLF
jgi:hypothetical protein